MKAVLLMIFVQTFAPYKSAEAVDLEATIKFCSAGDPDLNKCLKDRAQKLLPFLSGGIKELSIPALDPMLTPTATFSQHNKDVEITINYQNIIQRGASNIVVEEASADLVNKVLKLKLKYPVFSFEADYDAKGNIYDFQVNGKGRANITVWDALSDFTFKFHVTDDHVVEDSISIDYEFDKIFLDYSNMIVNDDPELSASAGTFINENSAEILSGFKNQLEEFYASITRESLKPFFAAVPYSVLFKGAP